MTLEWVFKQERMTLVSVFNFRHVLTVLWCGSALWTSCGQRRPIQEQSEPQLTVLDNALRVVVVEDPSVPIVSVVTSIHSGSANEDSTEEGAAHFLEHVILFRGTEQRTGDAVLDSMRRYGAYFNGHTTHDWTTFEISVPVAHFAPALTLQCEMVTQPLIDPKGVGTERSAILEELQRYEDSPVNMAYAIAQPLLFGNHPYARAVLGTRPALTSLSVESIRTYYRRNYVPNNMSVTIVGDVRRDEAINLVRRTYGPIRPQTNYPHERPLEPAGSKSGSVHNADVRQTVLMWSAVGPAITDDAIAAVDILSFVLAEGESSWLHYLLRSKTNWVNDVQADVNKRKAASVIFLYATMDNQHVDNVRNVVPQILDSLSRGGFADYEVERARNQLKTTVEIEMERTLGRAAAMAQYDAMGDYTLATRYRSLIDGVSRDDLAEAARRYFKSERFRLTAVAPKPKRP